MGEVTEVSLGGLSDVQFSLNVLHMKNILIFLSP